MFPFKVYNLVFKEIFKCEQSFDIANSQILTNISSIHNIYTPLQSFKDP